MSQEDKYDEIRAYLGGELSKEEMEAFTRLLEQDENLRREVAMWKELMAISSSEEQEVITPFREKVRKMVAETKNDARPISEKEIRRWSWIFFFIALGGLWWMIASEPQRPVPMPSTPIGSDTLEDKAGVKEPDTLSTSSSPVAGFETEEAPAEEVPSEVPSSATPGYLALAKEFYTPYFINAADRSSGNQASSRLGLANEAYNKGKWKEAIQYLNQDDAIPLSTEEKKLRAHAFFRSGQYRRAMEDFEGLASGGRYKANAEWNLLLCQLAQLPDIPLQTFTQSLEAILSDPNHSFHQKAAAVQERFLKIEGQ